MMNRNLLLMSWEKLESSLMLWNSSLNLSNKSKLKIYLQITSLSKGFLWSFRARTSMTSPITEKRQPALLITLTILSRFLQTASENPWSQMESILNLLKKLASFLFSWRKGIQLYKMRWNRLLIRSVKETVVVRSIILQNKIKKLKSKEMIAYPIVQTAQAMRSSRYLKKAHWKFLIAKSLLKFLIRLKVLEKKNRNQRMQNKTKNL